WLAGEAYNHRLSVTGLPTAAVLLYFFFRTHQPLTSSERDALYSARKRRKLTALGKRINPVYWTLSVILSFAGSASIWWWLRPSRWLDVVLLVLCLLILMPAFEYLRKELQQQANPKIGKFKAYVAGVIFSNLNLHKALVHNYYLKLGLYNLFH